MTRPDPWPETAANNPKTARTLCTGFGGLATGVPSWFDDLLICKNRSKPAPDFGRKRQVISAESGT